ncbi:hypothetical protein GCM10025788_02250 [Serinicoccus chungangensis]
MTLGPSVASVWDRSLRRAKVGYWTARARVRRQLSARLVSSAGAEAPAEPVSSGPAASRARARERATEHWNAGNKAESLETLRQARLQHGPDTWLCFAYGTRMLQLGHRMAAHHALRDSLELDPTNLDALEFFLDLDHTTTGVTEGRVAVLTALARRLPARGAVDADALAFLLPALTQDDVGHAVATSLNALAASEDPVAVLAATYAVNDAEHWTASGDDSLDRRARLLVHLGRGEHREALAELEASGPKEIPARALRATLRRELRERSPEVAVDYLQHYRRARPDDAWARTKLLRLTEGPMLSRLELIREGYPFRVPRTETAYPTDRGRALYCVHNSLPHHSAGYATRTQGLLSSLRAHGWDVTGVTRLGYPQDMPGFQDTKESAVHVDGVDYLRLSDSQILEPKNPLQRYVSRYAASLTELAEQQRPFVLHAASNHWNGLSVVEAAHALGLPSVYEVRGLWEVTRASRNPELADSDMFRFMSRMETDAARQATRVLAITGALRDELVRRGVDEDKIVLVPNGVDTTRFVPRSRNEALAAELGLAGRTVIGYVGSILNYEGIDLLIDAAATLRSERRDVGFLLVGDGAELSEYQERVEREGLADTVIFTGRVPHEQVEDYYSVIDIAPFPRMPLPVCEMVSPLKPFEAMAMGKSVVVSDVAALTEIVDDGRTGLVHRKGDADSLTHALRSLVDDPGLREQLADEGLGWVRQHRDWRALAPLVSEVYEELGGSRTADPAHGR